MLLQKFSFTESQDVMTLVHPVHGCLFDATSVCEILEYARKAGNVLEKMDDDEKVLLNREEYSAQNNEVTPAVTSNSTRGGAQSKWFVNEAGLYTLILGSEKPQAKAFKRWVTHEVLPALRRTGSYSMPAGGNAVAEETTPLERMASMLRVSPIELAQREMDACIAIFSKFTNITGNHALLAANRLFKHTYRIDMLKTADVDLPSKVQARCTYPTELGKRYGLSAIKINNILEMAGLQTFSRVKGHKVWKATPEGEAYSEYIDVGKEHSNGAPVQSLKWYETVLDHDKVKKMIIVITTPTIKATKPEKMTPTERLNKIEQNPPSKEEHLYDE